LATFLLDDKDGSAVDKINITKRGDVDECCVAMIHNYLKSGDVSWKHVLKSLRAADYKILASKIEKDLGIESMFLHCNVQNVIFLIA